MNLLSAALVALVAAQDPPKPVQTREEILKMDIEGAIQRLGSDYYTDSEVAHEELVELGRRAVTAVVAELNKKDVKPKIKRALCEILGRVRDPHKDAVAALVAKLKDTDEYGTSIATAAARALGQVGDDAAIPALIETLQRKDIDTDRMLKFECIRALGILRAREAQEPLRKALEDKKTPSVFEGEEGAPTIAAAAADALGLLRTQEAVEDLCMLLGGGISGPAGTGGEGLAAHAGRALQRILEHELRGKSEKDEPRVAPLTGPPDMGKKGLDAWRRWSEERLARKAIAQTRDILPKVHAAVEAFRKDQGKLPEVLDYLKKKPEYARVFPKEGYVQGDLKDGWGRRLLYRAPGTGADFDLLSYGKDNRPWGSGDDADLWNHDKWIEVKRNETRKTIEDTVKVLHQFKADQERWPETLNDLVVKPSYPLKKWEKPYLPGLPKDAFENIFFYRPSGTGGEPFDLISRGADGAEGGTGPDEDLWNHDKRPLPKPDEKN